MSAPDDATHFSLQHPPIACPVTGESEFRRLHSYAARPEKETRLGTGSSYHRELWQCPASGHILSLHDMDLGNIYSHDYVQATYGGADGIRETYERIMSFPPEQSDNYWRTEAVNDYARKFLGIDKNSGRQPTILDIGSGLCVFLAVMTKSYGWHGTALDPDPLQAAHAKTVVGIDVIHGDINVSDVAIRFDVLSLNKVLEHIIDPVSALRRAATFLKPGGLAYVELPDCEAAWHDPDGPEREEFFIEHHHGFTALSLTQLVNRAGLRLMHLDRIREPSGKYTFRSFCTPVA